MKTSSVNISFVIPVKDEEESIKPLYGELVNSMADIDNAFEVIFIDDGSLDATFKKIETLNKKDSRIKALRLRGNFGKSVALQIGFDKAQGDIVFTLDGDLQDSPAEIPNFLKELDKGYDLVSGWKKKRHDPLSKIIPSKIGNWLARVLTGVQIHDLNSGYKVYKKEVVRDLHLYGELYKYIPIIAAKQNFKVGEIIVGHRPRKYGRTKFGWERNIKGFLDLITIVFLTGYLRRPGHFFGTLGIISFFLGFVIGVYISYLRLTTGNIQFRHPLLFLGMLLMIIGIQLISTGLLAEMMVYSKQKFYYGSAIKQTLGFTTIPKT